jgi:hypothetical protein
MQAWLAGVVAIRGGPRVIGGVPVHLLREGGVTAHLNVAASLERSARRPLASPGPLFDVEVVLVETSIEPLPSRATPASELDTTLAVVEAWRAAERRLHSVGSDHFVADALRDEIEALQRRYQEIILQDMT